MKKAIFKNQNGENKSVCDVRGKYNIVWQETTGDINKTHPRDHCQGFNFSKHEQLEFCYVSARETRKLDV